MHEASAEHQESKSLLTSNIVYSTIAILIGNVALLVGNWAVIRWFGPSFHGNLAWMVALSGLLLLSTDFGLAGNAGIRRIAHLRAIHSPRLSKELSQLVLLPLCFAFATALLVAFCSPLIAGLRQGLAPQAIVFCSSWLLLLAGIRSCRSVSIGFERMQNIILMQPLAESLKTLWVFLCAFLLLPGNWIFSGWTVAFLLALVVSAIRLRTLTKAFGVHFTLPRLTVVQHLRTIGRAFPYHVPLMGITALPLAAQILVGQLYKGDTNSINTAISITQVFFSFALVSRLLAMPLSTALLPRMVHMNIAKETDERIGKLLSQTARLLGLATTAIFVGYLCLGEVILNSLFGAAYRDSFPALLWLVAALGIEDYGLQLDQFLMARKKALALSILELLRYLTTLIAACFLIPTMGILGIAIGILAGIVVNVSGKTLLARREIRHIGVLALVATLGTYSSLALLARAYPANKLLLVASWLLLILLFRLLRPSEIGRWCRAVSTVLSHKRR